MILFDDWELQSQTRIKNEKYFLTDVPWLFSLMMFSLNGRVYESSISIDQQKVDGVSTKSKASRSSMNVTILLK